MRTKEESGSATTGYLILSALTVVLLSLAFKDPLYLVFGIPLVLIFTLGASADKTGKGSVDDDLQAVGWSDKGMEIAIPFGIIGGMAALFLGGMMTRFTPETASILVPDFSGIANLGTAAVIPSAYLLSVNIISQWLVISPAEESLARVVAVFAFMKIFKNMVIAYVLAAFLWIGMHIPTFFAQNANQSMYLVLLLLAAITTGLFILTHNLISAIVAHGVFNTGVLLSASNFDTGTMYAVLIIAAILVYAWLSGVLSSGKVKT